MPDTTDQPAATARCAQCGLTYAEIDLEVGGRELRMQSCSNCDHRRWVDDDGELDLPGVLAAVSRGANAA